MNPGLPNFFQPTFASLAGKSPSQTRPPGTASAGAELGAAVFAAGFLAAGNAFRPDQ